MATLQTKQKCVIYARVSTDLQKTKVQIEELEKYADDNGFDIVKVFDETISGFIENRDELSSLKVFVKEHNIKHILCYELSRIGRSARQTLNEIDYFTKEGVNIFLKKDNLNTLNGSSTNKFLINILSVVSDFEVATFKDRSAGGIRSAILQGKTNGLSDLPFGYRKDENNKIAINKEEEKAVILIYDLCNKGTSLNEISKHLRSLGIKPRRKEIWYPKVIRTLIKKPIYKGIRIYKDIEIPVPGIVSVEDWNKAQERFEYHIGYINRSTHPYLLKGKIRCGECGKAWVSHTKKDGYSFYKCSNVQLYKDKSEKCSNNRFINTKLIDKGVFIALFTHPDLDQSVLKDEEKKSNAKELESQIINYTKDIKLNEAKIERAINGWVEGKYDKDKRDKLEASYKAIIKDLRNKILINEKALSQSLDFNLYDLLTSIHTSKDYVVKRDFVMKYIDKVEIYYIKESNYIWEKPLHLDDRIIYAKIFAFSSIKPVSVIMTTQTGQILTISVDEEMVNLKNGILMVEQ